MDNEAVKHETSTSYPHWQQFAITLHSQNLYLIFPLTEICYHALRMIVLLVVHYLSLYATTGSVCLSAGVMRNGALSP